MFNTDINVSCMLLTEACGFGIFWKDDIYMFPSVDIMSDDIRYPSELNELNVESYVLYSFGTDVR